MFRRFFLLFAPVLLVGGLGGCQGYSSLPSDKAYLDESGLTLQARGYLGDYSDLGPANEAPDVLSLAKPE